MGLANAAAEAAETASGDMTLVAPPRIIGTDAMAELLGVHRRTVTARVRAGDPAVLVGYLGKPGGKVHAWNASVLLGDMFATPEQLVHELDRIERRQPAMPPTCTVDECDGANIMAGLCDRHLRRLIHALASERQGRLVHAQLVAMCRWVVDRNEHIVLPAEYNGFLDQCMTPGCGNKVGDGGPVDRWVGPLCVPCAQAFWHDPTIKMRRRRWPKDKDRSNPRHGGRTGSLATAS